MVHLGDEVKDTVTGFSGVVISKHIFLYGVDTVTIQPKMEQYGVLPEADIFAEAQIRVTKAYKKIIPFK